MITDWDRQIIADIERSIARIETAIAGKDDAEMVRLPIGDARPETVSAHKATIARMRAEIAAIDPLAPIMEGAEVLTKPCQYKLATGDYVTCDPANLDAAETAIREAARRMGPIDGRTMFTVARRQLGDIAATRAAMMPIDAADERLQAAAKHLGELQEGDGVKWWNNPYPSGSKEAYAWDQGHTAARLQKEG